jgi:hypothetical protein
MQGLLGKTITTDLCGKKGVKMTIKEFIWIAGIMIAVGGTWGMTSQRINAMEKDVDRMETAIILFTKMESRIAVIETELKHINEKLDDMKK